MGIVGVEGAGGIVKASSIVTDILAVAAAGVCISGIGTNDAVAAAGVGISVVSIGPEML